MVTIPNVKEFVKKNVPKSTKSENTSHDVTIYVGELLDSTHVFHRADELAKQ